MLTLSAALFPGIALDGLIMIPVSAIVANGWLINGVASVISKERSAGNMIPMKVFVALKAAIANGVMARAAPGVSRIIAEAIPVWD